ncbi:hypothetical protein AKO1_002669 [Acrasis kona]|uniref:RGS domain-containing protein n=1 Tax=Acrasis kona TaxID=1008807 RepID=A0AAW2ZPE3_9EUKA
MSECCLEQDYSEFITLSDILSDQDARCEFQGYLNKYNREGVINFITEYELFVKLAEETTENGELTAAVDSIMHTYVLEGAPCFLEDCPNHLLLTARSLYYEEDGRSLLCAIKRIYVHIFKKMKSKYFVEYANSEEFQKYYADAGESNTFTPPPIQFNLSRRQSTISIESLDVLNYAALDNLRECINELSPQSSTSAEVIDLKKQFEEKAAYLEHCT